MLIDISKVLSIEDRTETFKIDIEMKMFKSNTGNYPISEKSPVELTIANIGKNRLLLEARFSVILLIPCDRCLEDVANEINANVYREIDMTDSNSLDKNNDEIIYFINDNEFDVEAFVYAEILMNLPMKILCSNSCKGICNRCGVNLNLQSCDCDTTELDPRMSKFLDVFKNI